MPLFVTLFFMLTVTSCSTEQHEWSEFSVYDKAIDIDSYVFPNGSGNQIFFKVKAQYPNQDVLNYYKDAINEPWIKCSDNNDWENFGDISGNEPLFIHQISQRWVNKDKNRLLLLAIKYRSQGSESRKTPDNNIQNVYLVEYFVSDVHETLSSLGAACNGV